MITCCNAFNVWPKTTLFPVWYRDAKRLDTPGNNCTRLLTDFLTPTCHLSLSLPFSSEMPE